MINELPKEILKQKRLFIIIILKTSFTLSWNKNFCSFKSMVELQNFNSSGSECSKALSKQKGVLQINPLVVKLHDNRIQEINLLNLSIGFPCVPGNHKAKTWCYVSFNPSNRCLRWKWSQQEKCQEFIEGPPSNGAEQSDQTMVLSPRWWLIYQSRQTSFRLVMGCLLKRFLRLTMASNGGHSSFIWPHDLWLPLPWEWLLSFGLKKSS